jgi:hypothetical protein
MLGLGLCQNNTAHSPTLTIVLDRCGWKGNPGNDFRVKTLVIHIRGYDIRSILTQGKTYL